MLVSIYLVKLPGHVIFDIVNEFSLVNWHVAGLGGDLIHWDNKGTLFTILLLDLKMKTINLKKFFRHTTVTNSKRKN